MIHSVEFRRGSRQQAHFDVELRRHLQTLLGLVRRATIFKQDYMPSAPVRTNHPEKSLVSLLHPLPADQQQCVATADIQTTMKYALLPIAGDWNKGLLASATITTVERRSLGDDRLVEHQQDGALAPCKSAF